MKTASLLTAYCQASVAEQAEQALRRLIREGALTDPLPGEHHLAGQLGISRSSLRPAMANLAKAGLIVRGNGRRARLGAFGAGRPGQPRPTVCLVCSASREKMAPHINTVVMELHAHFSSHGIPWEESFDAKLDLRHPEARLQSLVSHRQHVCWLLFGCSAQVLRWFSRAGLPAVVLGSCPPGVTLPSVDFNYPAVGRHAAGQLAKNGHRRIALLQPRRALTGDLDSWESFHGYFAGKSPRVMLRSVAIEADLSDLCVKLDQLMASRHRPTAIFCLHPPTALKTVFHLLRRGRRIPGEVSVLSRDSMAVFDAALPEISRYRGSNTQLFSRAVRIVQSMLAGHPVTPKSSLVMPAFIPGLTLGFAPEGAPAEP